MIKTAICGMSVVILLAGCSWPGGGPGQDEWMNDTFVWGEVHVEGPYPVGPNPSATYASSIAELGLYYSGTDQPFEGEYFYQAFDGRPVGNKLTYDYQYARLPETAFDLALCIRQPSEGWLTNHRIITIAGTVVPSVPDYGEPPYNLFGRPGNPVKFEVRGLPGEGYGTISGEVLISGEPVYGMRIIITPGNEPPELASGISCGWDVHTEPGLLGMSVFVLPRVPYGEYYVCVDVSGQAKRWDELRQIGEVVSLSEAAADAELTEAIQIQTSGLGRRPDGKGQITGTLNAPAGTDWPGRLVVAAMPPQDSDFYGEYIRAAAVWQVMDAGQAAPWETEFFLGWLDDGDYEVAVYYFTDGPEPEKLTATAEPVRVDVFNREVEGVTLKIPAGQV